MYKMRKAIPKIKAVIRKLRHRKDKQQTFYKWLNSHDVVTVKMFIRLANGQNHIGKTTINLNTLSWGFIKDELAELLAEFKIYQTVEHIAGLYKQSKKFKRLKCLAILSIYVYVLKQYKQMMEYESRLLHTMPDPYLKMAGIDQLNKYGIFTTLDALAQGDILKHEAILQMPYAHVLKKLAKDKDQNKIQEKYTQLKLKTKHETR